jgi:hypothetical protein
MSTHKKIDNLINMFNVIVDKIGKHLLNEFPGNIRLYSYDQIVGGIIKQNPRKAIDLFAEHIYANAEYRKAILEGDEKFFKSNRHENLTSSDEDRIKAMFQFKECWDQMTKESKQYIKKSMSQLVNISEMYVNFMCEVHKK